MTSKEACQDCFAKYYCSGGCHANHYHTNGSIGMPDRISCALQKKRIEIAIMMAIRRHLDGNKLEIPVAQHAN